MREFDVERTKGFITQSLKEEIHRRGFEKGVVGVSGGLDSAVVITLLTLSVGSKNAVGVIMPGDSTEKKEIKDAVGLLESLGVKIYRIDTAPMITEYFRNFPDAEILRRGNKMARERMSILYDISYLEEGLVIGTGNKTEYNLGYFTIYGDGSYAINPIGDLYKCEVRKLARNIRVPDEIICKTPTAGLWPGQTDEGELGYSYEELDDLLYNIIELKHSREKLLQLGFKHKSVEDVLNRIKESDFKRKLPYIITIPDGIKYAH